MKIAFSARGLSVPSGGVHQFIKSIIPALAKQRQQDQLFIFYNQKKFLGLAPDCEEIVIEGKNKLWWDFILLPKMLRQLKVDAVLLPKNVAPFFTSCRKFIVIHDMAYFERQLNPYPLLDTLYMKTMIPHSVRRANGVFAVSEHTKKDVIYYTKCDPDKITVAYEAADQMYKPVNDIDTLKQVKQKYNLPDKFILYAGSLSPRKNVVRLLKAFSRTRTKIPHNLVLTGSKSWKDSPIYKTMILLNLSSRINKLGFIEYNDMSALYNLADCCIYPSLYEGFGLPVLEAMQCGCPVITSNTTSIPEVAGDAALLIDPHDTSDIADAIHKILTDAGLREDLIEKGLLQAKKFSWDNCANTILEKIRTP